jgi:hypothetical protein
MTKFLMLAAAAALGLSASAAYAESGDYVPMYVQNHVMTTGAAERNELGVKYPTAVAQAPAPRSPTQAPPTTYLSPSQSRETISLFPPSDSGG